MYTVGTYFYRQGIDMTEVNVVRKLFRCRNILQFFVVDSRKLISKHLNFMSKQTMTLYLTSAVAMDVNLFLINSMHKSGTCIRYIGNFSSREIYLFIFKKFFFHDFIYIISPLTICTYIGLCKSHT